MKRYLLIGLTTFGLSGNAISQNDGVIMLGNLEPATSALVAGLESTLDALVIHQSAVEVFPALGDMVVNSGSALMEGTEQFGTWGAELVLLNVEVQKSAHPLAAAIDHPSLESLNAVLSYEDLMTVASNLGETRHRLIFGSVNSESIGLKYAAIELLKGNLVDPDTTIISGPSAIGSTLLGVAFAGSELFWDDHYHHGYRGPNVDGTLYTTALASNRMIAGPLAPIEESLVPVFESAEPLTSPIIQELEDFYPSTIDGITRPILDMPWGLAGQVTGLIWQTIGLD